MDALYFDPGLKCHAGEEKDNRVPTTQSIALEARKRENKWKKKRRSLLGLRRGLGGFSYGDTLCNLCIGGRT